MSNLLYNISHNLQNNESDLLLNQLIHDLELFKELNYLGLDNKTMVSNVDYILEKCKNKIKED